jgi:hypothetical protein
VEGVCPGVMDIMISLFFTINAPGERAENADPIHDPIGSRMDARNGFVTLTRALFGFYTLCSLFGFYILVRGLWTTMYGRLHKHKE